MRVSVVYESERPVIIREDGEAVEGESLEEVIVVGRVTYFVNRASDDGSPEM